MKKYILLLICFLGSLLFGQVTTNPSPPEADQPVTIFFDKTGTGLSSYGGTIYAHMGVTVNGSPWQNVIGNWGDNTSQPALTHVSGNTYSLAITPTIYNYFGVNTSSTINAINVVFRSADGSQQTNPDYEIIVGGFQVTNVSPANGSLTIVSNGGILPISATSTINADWILRANGTTVNTANNTTNFSYDYTVTGDVTFELSATNGDTTITNIFSAITTPTVQVQAIPAGIEQGVNYVTGNNGKVTLALYAPGKQYVHVIGTFNNWQISNNYLMKRDTANPDLYWIEIEGLATGVDYTFQYRTNDGIKTADPYSHLVLSPWDDPYITSTTYPNMPVYPEGQSFEVSWFKTGQTPYNWQVTNFERPAKENLIVYELLVRDFNTEKTWQSLIDQFDYFKNLKVNAIELMPVMEFEGNISWGYNTAFHLALDKAYGPREKMKQFIDLCHQNGIAVILDVALNHVYGRSPLVRMWMDDPDGDGFGNPTADNPYCNVEALHSYSVGYDLNHQSDATKYYVQRTVKHWIQEYKIDGFRWDLTKGFTNNCTASNESCTNAYQADRVAVLKEYADYQWSLDPEFIVIFEHLGIGGSHTEEIEWSNYRRNEGKGIMQWGRMNDQYNQNTMGYIENSNFNGMDFENRGFSWPAVVGYAESHDEERSMFKNLEYGNSAGTYDVSDLETSLHRTKALGAVLFTIPGPKMLWQFGEIGYDYSINHCQDGTINNNCRTDPKPIPGEIGYFNEPARMEVYDTWADIIELRLTQEVFNTTTFDVQSGDLMPRIYIWNDDLPTTQLKNVVILANFSLAVKQIPAYFPYTGTWYNLLDESTLNVTVTGAEFTVSLQPGEFRIFGNQLPELEITEPGIIKNELKLYPVPAKESFYLNEPADRVEVYDLSGKLIRAFDGVFPANHAFYISGLNIGIYQVKIIQGTKVYRNRLIKK